MSIGTRTFERYGSRHAETESDTAGLLQKAIEHAAIGNFSEAIDVLHEVTKATPDHFHAWKTKATLYRLMGNRKMAELCSETAKALDPRK